MKNNGVSWRGFHDDDMRRPVNVIQSFEQTPEEWKNWAYTCKNKAKSQFQRPGIESQWVSHSKHWLRENKSNIQKYPWGTTTMRKHCTLHFMAVCVYRRYQESNKDQAKGEDVTVAWETTWFTKSQHTGQPCLWSSFLFLVYMLPLPHGPMDTHPREAELEVSGLPYKWSQTSDMGRKDTEGGKDWLP